MKNIICKMFGHKVKIVDITKPTVCMRCKVKIPGIDWTKPSLEHLFKAASYKKGTK